MVFMKKKVALFLTFAFIFISVLGINTIVIAQTPDENTLISHDLAKQELEILQKTLTYEKLDVAFLPNTTLNDVLMITTDVYEQSNSNCPHTNVDIILGEYAGEDCYYEYQLYTRFCNICEKIIDGGYFKYPKSTIDHTF